MILQIHRKRCQVLFCLLLATFPTSVAHAQVNYLSIFGNAGCSNNNRMTCAVTPASSSFTGIPTQDDPDVSISPATDFYKNSVYDRAGNILFSVNANGLYAPDGYQLHNIESSVMTWVCPGPSTEVEIETTTKNSMSEFAIFPVPGTCYSYYVMFWSRVHFDPPTFAYTSPHALRILRVDINSTLFGGTSPISSWYTITDKLMEPPICSNYNRPIVSTWYSPLGIVANKVNSDNSRDIYTLKEDYVLDGIGNVHYSPTIKKWHFPSDGSIPTSSTTIFTTPTYGDPALMRTFATKTKLFQIPSGTPGISHSVIAYVGKNWSDNGSYLQTYNLNTGDRHVYKAPLVSGSIDGEQNIMGFEYLEAHNILCFSYNDFSILSDIKGGLGYATPGTGTSTTNITPVISILNWGYSLI